MASHAMTLVGMRTGQCYPPNRIEEFGSEGETLEVFSPSCARQIHRNGHSVYERFRDFWPLRVEPEQCSLGEGQTPLLRAPHSLKVYTGLDRLYLKNETANPTWSFKDRGTVVCCALARQLGEPYLATISTGNMGQSVAAYAARCGLKALIVVPATASPQKLQAAAVYGATILRVETDDLCHLKHELAAVAKSLGLRITTGANPFRVEGYKFEAFEMWEQLDGVVPDFVVVPTSAGGHIRGIFKGWQELEAAGLVESLPTMVLVQAASNAPLADALLGELPEPVPYPPAKTYASALTSNDPPGGANLLRLAQNASWLGATVAEEAIREAWEIAARAGLWVEPSSAIVLPALRQLAARGVIPRDACVVASVTGAGPKDMRLVENSSFTVVQTTLAALENQLKKFLSEL